MGVAGVTWPCMSKPKAAISSWASPSDEVSTVSDIDEGKRMAALRWRSCCWWDLAYGISLQSPPALLGRQQKKTPTRVIHPAKRKKQAQRGGRAGWEMEGCRWCRRMATVRGGLACMAPMQVGEWLWGSYGDELGAGMAGSRVCKTEHPLCEQPELSCCCFLIGNKRGHSLKQRPPVYNALKILRLRKPPRQNHPLPLCCYLI